MTLLLVSVGISFVLGCILTKKIYLATYSYRMKELIEICDDFQDANRELADELETVNVRLQRYEDKIGRYENKEHDEFMDKFAAKYGRIQ